MDVQVNPAALADQPRLQALMQLYAYDLSELLRIDIGDDGRFALPAIDDYWRDPRRHPFLIRADGKLAGFALVQRRSRLTGDESVTDMAELFVMRRLRRNGVGARASVTLFDRFAGSWEVRQKADNLPAIEFWRRTITRYSDGRFEEQTLDDERWRGPVQRFDSRLPARPR